MVFSHCKSLINFSHAKKKNTHNNSTVEFKPCLAHFDMQREVTAAG